jgi:hypothetical protein
MSALGQKQTFGPFIAMSALPPESGHRLSATGYPLCATWRPEQVQHKLWLLDHLVGSGKQRLWNAETERFGGLEIDDQLDLDGLLDRQISRLVTFEAELLGVVAPVCQMPRRRGGIIRPPLT